MNRSCRGTIPDEPAGLAPYRDNQAMSFASRRALLAAGLGLATQPALTAGAEAGWEWRPWPRGKRVPRLELERLGGTRWRLQDARGHALMLNFWATWCEPCRAEMPSLMVLARQRENDGLRVMAVNYREGAPAIQRFVDALRLQDLPVLLDREGSAARDWTPRIFPSTVLIDRRGRPAGVLVGQIDWASAEAAALIEPLLAAKA
jgi:thiol-disulfide isomerase/thioredoxin